jgi:hypothetical protein
MVQTAKTPAWWGDDLDGVQANPNSSGDAPVTVTDPGSLDKPVASLGDAGTTVPVAPPGVSVDDNMRRARQIQDALGGGMLPSDPAHGIMVSWVAPGQEMDYKQHGGQYRDFGNFNYGAVGTALGITPYELHGAAGVVQMKQNNWRPGYGVPFLSGASGDNKRDYDQIERGIAYARAHRPK